MPNKYESHRDEALHAFCLEGLADDEIGDVAAPFGYVWLIGSHTVRENGDGSVTVVNYPPRDDMGVTAEQRARVNFEAMRRRHSCRTSEE